MSEANGSLQPSDDLGMNTAKNSIVYVASKLTSSLIIFIILIFLARFLKPEYYGLYTIVVAFYTLLGASGNFGIGTTLRKKLSESNLSKDEINKRIINGLAIALSLGLVLMVIGLLLSSTISIDLYKTSSLINPFRIASIIILFNVLYGVTTSVLFGINKVNNASKINIIYSLTQVISVVGLVLLGYGILGAVSGILISLIIASALTWYSISRSIKISLIKPIKKDIKEMLSFSFPVLVSNISNLGLTSFAIIFLALFVAPSIIGSYGVAYRFGRIIEVITVSLSVVLLPTFSNIASDSMKSDRITKLFNKSIYYAFLFISPFIVYLISTSRPFMHLFFSSLYSDAYIYFSFIILGLFINLIGILASQLMIGYGKTREFLKYQVLVIIIELILLLLITPFLKVYGVLLSIFLIGPIIFSIIYYFAVLRVLRIRISFNKPIKVSASSIITFLVMYLISFELNFNILTIILNLIILLIIYIPLLVIFRGLDLETLDFIGRLGDRYHKLSFISKAIINYSKIFMNTKK